MRSYQSEFGIVGCSIRKGVLVAAVLLFISSNFVFTFTSVTGKTFSDPIRQRERTVRDTGDFIENLGQFEDSIFFIGGAEFGRIGFRSSSILFDVGDESGGTVFEYSFLESNPVIPKGEDATGTLYNYYLGNDQDRWVSGARSYTKIVYPDLWDGIDLKYAISNGAPKYEFVVAPGSDPGDISIKIKGHDSFFMGKDLLTIRSGEGVLSDGGLFVYQPGIDGEVKSSFTMRDRDTFGFEVSSYDKNKELVIDPEITYSAQIGGNDGEYGVDLAVDNSGYLYVMGRTQSSDFPVTTGSYTSSLGGDNDIFIFKLDPSGSEILAATYFGGTNGNEYERCGIALTSNGNVIISGDTRSNDLPLTTGVYDEEYNGAGDMYVASFDSDFSTLLFSTYLGAHETEYFGAIMVSEDGSIIISGGTESTDYPTTTGAYDREKGESTSSYEDVVVSRLDSSGTTLINSTFLGGDGDERGTSLHEDSDGNIYVGGWTSADDFPTTPDGIDTTYNHGSDCFVAILDPHLTDLQYSTFFGGTEEEGGGDTKIGMGVSDSGMIFIGGFTSSPDLPTDSSSYQQNIASDTGTDSFVASFQGNILYGCTYYGGTDNDMAVSLALDFQSNVILAGATKSTDLPLSPDAQYSSYSGGGFVGDSMIVILSPDLSSLYYSTYFGGSSDDVIGKVKSTPDGSLYFCGGTASSDYPETHDFEAPDDSSGNVAVMVSGGFTARDPLEIYSLNAYADPSFSQPAGILDKGETVYIELRGLDANDSTRDGTRVNITFSKGGFLNTSVWLRETDYGTGIYRNSFRIPQTAEYFENITIYADKDPIKRVVFQVDTPVRLNTVPTKITLTEHENLSLAFENLGWFEDAVWSFATDSHWIDLDNDTHTIDEVPENPDVGTWRIWVNITDENGNSSEVSSTVIVSNLPPKMAGDNLLSVKEGEHYHIDYDSDEDEEGGIVWVLISDASWLSLNRTTGVLNGTPQQEHVGNVRVGIVVRDGNGGTDDRYFNITVFEVNDPPRIITTDITRVIQGDPYQRKYEVEDVDPGDSHTWTMLTDAQWLFFNKNTAVLYGTPGPNDVGNFTVNITVEDSEGATDSNVFQLEVSNINDPPFFTDLPFDLEVTSGKRFVFDVNASDPDEDTILEFSLRTTPRSSMKIDPNTGLIEWDANLEVFDSEPYIMLVEVTIDDDELQVKTEFELVVTRTLPPTTTLLSPATDSKASFRSLVVSWEGIDPEMEPLTYDVYVGENQAFVAGKREETLYIADHTGTSIELTGLTAGRTYHWTVIPFDGGSYGTCLSNTFSFRLNSPPAIEEIGMHEAVAGKEFKLLIKAEDQDQDDLPRMRYYLDSAPDGMIIGEQTGLITWIPGNQEIQYNVIVNVTDGHDHTYRSFLVEVTPASEEEGSNVLIFVIIGLILMLIMIGIIVLLLVFRRRGNKEEGGTDEEKDEEEATVHSVSSVPLSTTEAHAHLGKGSKKVSYEDLYGIPAPEKDDQGMTAKELRDYIHDQILEIEEMPEEEDGLPEE